MTSLEQEKLIRQFLLGEVSQTERERLEELLFTDEEFSSQVEAMEDELIDEYVLDGMGAPAKEMFRQHFLITPERRERLEFAIAFQRAMGELNPPNRAATADATPSTISPLLWLFRPRMAAVAFGALALFACVLALLWFGNSRTPEQPLATHPETPSPTFTGSIENPPETNGKKPDANANELAQDDGKRNLPPKPKVISEQRTFPAVVLFSGVMRTEGKGLKQISLPANAKGLRLELIVDDGVGQEETSLEAELQNGDGEALSGFQNLKTLSKPNGNRFVSFTVPAERLPAGDYQVVLQSDRSKGGFGKTMYYFRVKRVSGRK